VLRGRAAFSDLIAAATLAAAGLQAAISDRGFVVELLWRG
jgi:hypothetical protein